MKRFLVTLLFFVCFGCAFSQKRILNPVADFISGYGQESPGKRTIHKIVFDFNGDGRQDMALSDSWSWGNAGGDWYFYFRRPDGSYYYFDKIETLHPFAYSVQRRKGRPSVILVYLRHNCCSGEIARYQVGSRKFAYAPGPVIGEDKSMTGEEVAEAAGKIFGSGKTGAWWTADLNCLIRKAGNCWSKSR